jgi:carboxyl-terminal processing protease
MMASMSGRTFALALLAVAALWAARPTDPGPAGADRSIDENLKRLEVFFHAFERVQNEYVDTAALDPPDTLVRGAIEGMIRALDPYSHYLPPPSLHDLRTETRGEFGGLGIMIGIERDRLTVIAPIEGTPADRAGLRPGDVITHIDDESTEGMPLPTAVSKLRGEVRTSVTIRVVRGEKALPPLSIVRELIQVHTVKWTVLSDSVGVLRITHFTDQTAKEVAEVLGELRRAGAAALVLDLRGNPGGVLQAAVSVADLFVETGALVSTRGRVADQNQEFRATGRAAAARFPLVVLVDKGSASASEIVAGAIRDSRRGVLVGQRTFGKGSVQSVRQLPDGSGLALTTAYYYTPAGTRIHGAGLTPDVEVEGRKPPEGAELEALQKDEFRDILNDFTRDRRAYTPDELRDLGRKVREANLEISDEMLEFLVLRDMTRRTDRGLFLKPALDPQLKAAMDLLKATPLLAVSPS